jgi:raffinose/stachyose/melibiose transport system substrate-binding protein
MNEHEDAVAAVDDTAAKTEDAAHSGLTRRGFLRAAAGTTAALAAGAALPDVTRAAKLAAPAFIRSNASMQLTMWHAKPELRSNYQKVLDAFHADFPDITITQTPKPAGPTYTQLVHTAAAAGELPDIFSEPDTGLTYRTVAKGGGYLDLTSRAPNAKNLIGVAHIEDFIGSKLWKVSWGRYTVVMMYNKKLLAKFGLQPPVDWADWLAQCKKIQAAGTTPISMAGDGTIDAFFFTELATAALGRQGFNGLVNGSVKWDAQPIVDTMQFLLDLQPYYQPGFLATRYADSKALFATERVVYFEAGSADVPGFKNINPNLEIGVFPFPPPKKGGTRVTLSGLDETMAGSPKTKYPDAVGAFMNWCASPKGGALCSAAINLSPVVKGVLPPKSFPELKEIISFSQNDFPVWYAVETIAPGFNIWATQGQGLFTKRLTPAQLAKLLQQAGDKARKDAKL